MRASEPRGLSGGTIGRHCGVSVNGRIRLTGVFTENKATEQLEVEPCRCNQGMLARLWIRIARAIYCLMPCGNLGHSRPQYQVTRILLRHSVKRLLRRARQHSIWQDRLSARLEGFIDAGRGRTLPHCAGTTRVGNLPRWEAAGVLIPSNGESVQSGLGKRCIGRRLKVRMFARLRSHARLRMPQAVCFGCHCLASWRRWK